VPDGIPYRFGVRTIDFSPGIATVLQFQVPKLRYDSNVTDAFLKLETSGHRWQLNQGAMFTGDLEADAVFDIRAERSAHSMPARVEENDVAGRVWTTTAIEWSIPVAGRHEIIVSPDLSPLLRELQSTQDWKEVSAITLQFTPCPGSTGAREYKILLT
jgi:hypothetical protein